MAVRFAPNDPLTPEPLRQRIESWHQNPPKTQFQQYGPLNVYLCIKYPPKAFLVKPQALFRDLWTTDKMEQEDIAAITDILLGGADHTMDIDQKEINRRASLDSQGALVQADQCHYPDFAVTTYGPDLGDKDVIRLVIEVGSLGRDLREPSINDKQIIVRQLLRYLSVMGVRGVRWADKAVGMCIIGTEVAIIQSGSNGKFPRSNHKWISLYSQEFQEAIDSLATP